MASLRHGHFFALSLLFALAAAGDAAADDFVLLAVEDPPRLEEYVLANEAETRLSEYRDGRDEIALKLHVLETINENRAKFKAPPVELDILASRVANRQCREAAAGGWTGHWNERGEKPYQRWALAGGRDHVSENAASVSSSGELGPYLALGYMLESHERFMAEKAPNDGHKVNVIDKRHTHVGLGFAFDGGQFRYYEEYLDRYFDRIEGPESLAPGETGEYRFEPREGYFVYAAIVYWEALPAPMRAAAIEAKGAYPDHTSRQVLGLWPGDFTVAGDGSVSLKLSWKEKGSYYVQVYLDTKAPPTTGSFATAGKIQASGLVIFVK